ncbi:protoporphyrinogen oxidase [Planctomycetes bacterium Poly30]|uniref:Protoporphyrinogen oxidase n=1 Tax=Saltatorellus ferox TaxID=2528018 RepID=A0A518ENG6_9BACT|nr:protoporphyrinogen oxidase [Planctomycetes bacterium Poly30]
MSPSPARPSTASETRSADLRVAIVGAGLSGLRAARILQDSGRCDVQLFEKARGVGGRTSLRRADSFAFDHGAQYFTARDAGFRAQVDAWVEAGVAAPFEAKLAGIPREGSLQFKKSDSTERFVGMPGMNAMAKAMAEDLMIEVRARVDSLEPEDDGRWTLRFIDGREESGFDVVLVTAPAPQAKALVAASEKLREVAASVSMQPCWAAMVVFAERFDAPFDGAFIDAGPLSWACRNSAKPGRPEGDAWVLHASPAWTQSHLDLEREEIASRLTTALGEAAGIPTPEYLHADAHRWMYSNVREPREDGAVFDDELGLGLAGDWLNGAKVQGAWLSGQALAEAVLAARAR